MYLFLLIFSCFKNDKKNFYSYIVRGGDVGKYALNILRKTNEATEKFLNIDRNGRESYTVQPDSEESCYNVHYRCNLDKEIKMGVKIFLPLLMKKGNSESSSI